MADEVAEAAFINAMQNYDATAEFPGEVDGGSQQQTDPTSDDEYDPASAVQTDSFATDAQPLSVPSPSTAVKPDALPSTSTLQNTTPSATAAPLDLPDPNVHNQSRSNSAQSTRNHPAPTTKTEQENVPGLPAMDADSGHADAELGALENGDPQGQASHTASSVLPDSISTPNVSLQNDVQDHPSAEVTSNGVAAPESAVLASPSDPTAVPQGNFTVESQGSQVASHAAESSTAHTSGTTSVSLPKARLPHDRIGILEDRIREDPRGDLDAWLSLIAEHRKRGKIDDARNAYERFLGVFPWAVSLKVLVSAYQVSANGKSRRPSNGRHTPKWKMKLKIEVD